MARSYPYGKVPKSVGTVVSERFETPMVCCGYASTQFAVRATNASVGNLCKNFGHRMRTLGGRPHNAGSNAGEQRNGAKRAAGVTLTGINEAAVLARIKAGFVVTVTIRYAKLPGYLKVQTNDFGHCSALKGYRVVGTTPYVGYFDPLYAQGSQGTWAKFSDLRAAMYDTGHNTTTVKR